MRLLPRRRRARTQTHAHTFVKTGLRGTLLSDAQLLNFWLQSGVDNLHTDDKILAIDLLVQAAELWKALCYCTVKLCDDGSLLGPAHKQGQLQGQRAAWSIVATIRPDVKPTEALPALLGPRWWQDAVWIELHEHLAHARNGEEGAAYGRASGHLLGPLRNALNPPLHAVHVAVLKHGQLALRHSLRSGVEKPNAQRGLLLVVEAQDLQTNDEAIGALVQLPADVAEV
mmetsp:Transcript_14657/g.45372  ORF Transcript_14657/g.45372 Transcript_14657/m.45372 type:complete len:228 (-) Transcript_14657:544-1227(-)